MINATILVVFPFSLALAALSDLLTMTIPNRVSLVLLVSFFFVAPLAGLDLAQLGLHTVAAGLIFAVSFALFAANVMGGGDAKLLTASAAWFGFNESLVTFLVYVSFFGGIPDSDRSALAQQGEPNSCRSHPSSASLADRQENPLRHRHRSRRVRSLSLFPADAASLRAALLMRISLSGPGAAPANLLHKQTVNHNYTNS